MKKYTLLLCFILSGCSLFKPKERIQILTLLMGENIHSFIIKEKGIEKKIYSSLAHESTPITMVNSDVYKVLENKLGESLWHHTEDPKMEFNRVFLAPFYSLYTYEALYWLNSIQGGIFNPGCPIETKYFLIVFHGNKKFPLFGCVI